MGITYRNLIDLIRESCDLTSDGSGLFRSFIFQDIHPSIPVFVSSYKFVFKLSARVTIDTCTLAEFDFSWRNYFIKNQPITDHSHILLFACLRKLIEKQKQEINSSRLDDSRKNDFKAQAINRFITNIKNS